MPAMQQFLSAVFLTFFCVSITSCAQTQTIRMSGNTMMIQTSGAPACGLQGSMKVAEKMAAVETLRAGFDRYQILGSDAQNNVTSQTMPGTVHHNGYVMASGNYANYSGSSSYSPGPTIIRGTNDVMLNIKMFKKGDVGYKNAIPAKEALGSDWQKLVESGVKTCS